MTLGVFRRESNKPNVFGVMTSPLSIMQDRLTRSRLAGDPPDVQITPRVGHISLLEFERAEELIREGRRHSNADAPNSWTPCRRSGLRQHLDWRRAMMPNAGGARPKSDPIKALTSLRARIASSHSEPHQRMQKRDATAQPDIISSEKVGAVRCDLLFGDRSPKLNV
jgi:hypothetical protein